MSPADIADDEPAHDATMVAPTRFLRASWSPTLRLPKSSFPPRPLPEHKAEYLRRCTDELYAWQQTSRSAPNADGKTPETFTLHDGPPYANGPLHIGHSLNKITKDIICRFQIGQGKKVSYIPGWDCHGLPIEIKALQAQKKDLAQTDPVSVREAARELAANTIEEQKKGFKEWAVMGDWDNAYKTMEKGFEIRQLEVFKTMFEKGLIYRQFKPVYWSPSSRTALAEAELEYDENHSSLAAFVRFPVHVTSELQEGALKSVAEPVSVVIWTTTPWTLPANKAIAVHRDMEYSVVQDSRMNNEKTIVASSRVEEYQKMLGRDLIVVLSGLRGSDLAGQLSYENPFQKANGLQPVLHADFVTDSSGTGLVHMAPGHGMEDYHACSAIGIEAFAPVDDAGTFTKEAFPEQPELLEGLAVSDLKKTGSNAILNYLDKHNLLRAKHNFRHKYPIDWRTKKPVIVRATAQWFANVDNIKTGAMKAIEDWCISRQRAWGVPIPALFKILEDGQLEAAMDEETIQHVIDVIKERGVNSWWTDAQDDPVWQPKHLSGSYVRGRDTMDVWFDSGTTWTMLPSKDNQPLADVYLEGTDQHRGWFQSSLLTHVATQPFESGVVKAPYKTLITHGFTLDSDGRKMSKSLGNVIAPSQIMSGELLPPVKRKKQKGVKQAATQNAAPTYDAMGSDALRLWVASSDYTRDVTVGQPVLMSVNQALHKYRVTFKWLLGVRTELVGQYDLEAPLPPLKNLGDRLAVHRLSQVSHEVHGYYTKYGFFKGVNMLNKYITNDLSAFYFETLKDRIYTGHKADCQDLQKVLGLIFYELLQMLAPICPLLVEEVWDHATEALKNSSLHPARMTWTPLPRADWNTQIFLTETQTYIDRINTALKAAQERLRADKKIGSSLESAITIYCEEDRPVDDWFSTHFAQAMGTPEAVALSAAQLDELAGLFVVSGVEKMDWSEVRVSKKMEGWAWKEEEGFVADEEREWGGTVVVHEARGEKCPRCWRFQREAEEALCGRCEDVVKEDV
ncbi:isoleucine-tRNA ligase [Kalmusia sp. IMI 367209]|nr:isoleucine-tRNA ligase [Kalmusia sp. IMI 367209]